MELFSILCVEIIGSSIELNEFVVMTSIVEFCDVEMVANPKGNKNITVLMECIESIIHLSDSFGCMNGISCQINEIKDSAD